MGQFVDLRAADGVVTPAWVARPEGKVRGAVVVLQEIFGVNSHIQSVANRFAEQGYLAVAPSMFARVEPNVNLGYAAEDMAKGQSLKAAAEALPAPGVMADVQAAIAYAAEQSGGKVGVVGFCWGGLLTWRTACTLDGVDAAVCYYGGGMTSQQEVARTPRTPVLAHFGEKDHWIPVDQVQAFAKQQPKVEVHVYAADHGFNCDQRGSYDAAAAATALERSLAFFAQHVAA